MFHDCLSIRSTCPRLTPLARPGWYFQRPRRLWTPLTREKWQCGVQRWSHHRQARALRGPRASAHSLPHRLTRQPMSNSAPSRRAPSVGSLHHHHMCPIPRARSLAYADADGNSLHAKRSRETAPPPSNTSQCSCSAPHAGTGTGRAPDQNDTRRQVLVAARDGRRERASAATAEQTRLLAGCGPAFGRLSPPTHRRRRRRGQRGGNGHRGGEGGARSWRWCGRDGAFSVAPTLLACFPQAAS